MIKLLEYLPTYYVDIPIMTEILNTEVDELDLIAGGLVDFLESQFIDTSSEWAIKRREMQLEIRADPATETIEFRRKRLVNRYSTKPPFSVRVLQNQLNELIGVGLAVVEEDIEHFVLIVTIGVSDAPSFAEIERTIHVMKPANLIYQQRTSVANKMAFEEHIYKTALIRKTKLGSWHIGVSPFAILGAEVQVK